MHIVQVLQCLLHCADLSNPTKPPEIASTWAYNIIEENFVQGDEEKKLGIDVGPLGDRDNVCVEKCQVGSVNNFNQKDTYQYFTFFF